MPIGHGSTVPCRVVGDPIGFIGCLLKLATSGDWVARIPVTVGRKAGESFIWGGLIFMTRVAIVGAGPYGLSIAAHLRSYGVPFRIFGTPLDSWRRHMPVGMMLKSYGFASNLSAPDDGERLRRIAQSGGFRITPPTFR